MTRVDTSAQAMAHWCFHTKVSLWVRHSGCMDAHWAGCLLIFLALSTHFSVLLPSEKGSASVANRMWASSRCHSSRKSPADPGWLVPYEMEGVRALFSFPDSTTSWEFSADPPTSFHTQVARPYRENQRQTQVPWAQKISHKQLHFINFPTWSREAGHLSQ